MASERKSSDERKELLSRQVASMLSQGRRIESQSDYQAVLVYGHRPNHILHLILTFLTLGAWGLVWLGLAFLGGEKREVIQVDEWGNSSVSRL